MLAIVLSGSGVARSSFLSLFFSAGFIFIFGSGIVNNGFLVRTIIDVVAMYIGSADNINMPNTNPGNPRNSARARRIQFARKNISKLNKPNNIAHINAI